MQTTAANLNDAAKNQPQTLAQHNTASGQDPGVNLASNAEDSMDVDRRQKRIHEQPTSKSIVSSPTNPKKAPSQRTENAAKALASRSHMGTLGVNALSDPEDDVPLPEKYNVVGRGRGRTNKHESRTAPGPGNSQSPASWRHAAAGVGGATQKGVRRNTPRIEPIPPPLPQPPMPNKLKGHSLTLCHIVAPTPDGHPTSSGQTNKFRRPIPISLAETRAKLS